MSKKIRYSLIILGFLVFVILAPIIVIYVRGLTYDFTTHRFIKTGILSLKTDPSAVNIYLNNKVVSQNGSNIRFLVPGEYDLKLNKPGFFDWVKRLTINPGSVAWVYPAYTKIYLLKNPPLVKTVGDGVLDFSQNDNSLAFLTSNNLIVSSLDNLGSSQNYTLPEALNTIMTSNGGNFLLTQSGTTTPTVILFRSQDKTFTNLSANFKQMPQFRFLGSTLYALDNGTLYNFEDIKNPLPLLTDVKTFTIDGGTLYYISQNGSSTAFSLSQNFGATSQTITNNLPKMNEAKIIVDANKHVFVLADGALYRIATKLELLANNVSDYGLDESGSQLVYVAGGEVHQYDGTIDSDTLLTRSINPLQNIILSTGYNYIFYSDEAGLTALDLNTNSPRNEYSLYFGQIKKLTLDSGAGALLLLDGSTLKSLVIR